MKLKFKAELPERRPMVGVTIEIANATKEQQEQTRKFWVEKGFSNVTKDELK